VRTRLAAAAVLGLFIATQAHALALGELTLQSGVGEPLRAEIRVLDVSAEDAGTLRAVVATPGTFLAAGADYNPALSTVLITVSTGADGAYLLRLAGTRAIRDEFLDLIVEASTVSGRVLRDYTLHVQPTSGRTRR
jgi:pilus assembly protein FimV